MRSFVTFNEYLEAELGSVNAANRTFSGYGTTGGSLSGERKVLSEATMGFKSEIRSIKGTSDLNLPCGHDEDVELMSSSSGLSYRCIIE